jgi:hypothetical protein
MARKYRDPARTVPCAVCGRPNGREDRMTAADGSIVCAADCLGAMLADKMDERHSPETTGLAPSWARVPGQTETNWWDLPE